jgi:hypothetical protein
LTPGHRIIAGASVVGLCFQRFAALGFQLFAGRPPRDFQGFVARFAPAPRCGMILPDDDKIDNHKIGRI